ncbi:MAG: hypothetical protein PHH54_03460 [Candidatus Nanoarchaeia archaeon]|nr:hypothetical protein [Candidatus Nanoarchaeia archaeon]MDD5741015.1 hypothetical protein [Candidatus Nanoarchaeia archaeon]
MSFKKTLVTLLLGAGIAVFGGKALAQDANSQGPKPLAELVEKDGSFWLIVEDGNDVNDISAKIKKPKLGSALVEEDGSYWLIVEDGNDLVCRAYTKEHYRQGSFASGPFFPPFPGKFCLEYGKEGRAKVADYEKSLPAMEISEKGDNEISIDGKISGEKEFLTFSKGMKKFAPYGNDANEMLKDRRLDAVEIHHLYTYGPVSASYHDVNATEDSDTKYVLGEIDKYCQNRIDGFIEKGADKSDVSDLGILAVFDLKDAMIIKGLKKVLKEQSEYNEKHPVTVDYGFFIDGKLGEINTAKHSYFIDCDCGHVNRESEPEGRIDVASKVINYLNTISKSDAERMARLFKDYQSRTEMRLSMGEGGLDFHFQGVDDDEYGMHIWKER